MGSISLKEKVAAGRIRSAEYIEEVVQELLKERKQLADEREVALCELVVAMDALAGAIEKVARPIDQQIEACEKSIKRRVLGLGKSVKTPSATATYTKPSVRRSCKYDALEGYGKAHPEVLEFIAYKDVAARVSIKVH